MTPHSADRAHTISPLDVFGPSALGASSASQPDHQFEAVLKDVSSFGKSARLPPDRGRTERASEPSAARQDNNRSAEWCVVTKNPKKQPVQESSPSTPDSPPDDDRSEDVTAEQSSAQAAIATPPAPQQPAGDGSSPDDRGEEPEISILESGLLPVTIAPIQVAEDAISDHQGANAASDGVEGTSPTTGIAIPTVPSSDDRLSERDEAAAVQGSGSLSLADPVPEAVTADSNSGSADPLVAIDGESVASDERPSGTDENHSSDQNEPDANADGTVQPADPLAPTLAADTPTKSEQASSAAAPPPGNGEIAHPENKIESGAGLNSNSTAAAAPQSPSRLPQHVLARSENHRGHSPAPVPVDSARFISRVAKAFHSAQQRDGEVRLRLSPPELGSLRLQVSVQDGVMVARMETETEAARSSLVNNLPTLRERLAEQGIRVERFDIDLMQRPSTGTPDRPSDPQQQPEPQPLRAPRAASAPVEISNPKSVASSWNGNGRLNVII